MRHPSGRVWGSGAWEVPVCSDLVGSGDAMTRQASSPVVWVRWVLGQKILPWGITEMDVFVRETHGTGAPRISGHFEMMAWKA